MTSSGPDQPSSGSAAPGGPAAPRRGPDLRALRLGDLAVAAGTALYLLCAALPWYSLDAYDLGSGYRFPAVSVNGFDSGLVVAASLLLILATAWALLPAWADVPVPVPRAAVTIGLAVPAVLLTLVEWLSDLDVGFSVPGLLTLLCSGAVLAVAVLRLLPPAAALARVLAGAAAWADRPVRSTRRAAGADQPAGPPPAPDQPGTAPVAGPPPGRPAGGRDVT